MPNTVKCPSCGGAVSLPDGRDSGFCPNCGAKISAPAQAASNWAGAPGRSDYSFDDAFASPSPQPAAAADYGQYAPAAQKKKRALRISPKLLIIAAAVVVVAAAGVFFVLPALGGGAYQKAEVAFIQGIVTKVPLAADEGQEIEFDISYEASGDMEYNAGLTDMALYGLLSYAGQEAAATLTLEVDGTELSDVDMTFDGNELTLSVPNITQYFIRMAGAADSSEAFDISSLDQKKLEASLTAVAKEYFKITDELGDVEKGVELSGGAASVKCDKYTIDFTEEALARIGLAAIGELRANDNLMEFICGAALQMNGNNGYDIDDMMDEFEETLDELEDELDGLDGDDRLFRMTVWIDGNTVVSRKIDKIEGASNVSFSYQYIVTKNAINLEVDARLGGSTSVSLECDLVKSGGAWSGDPELRINDYGDIVSIKAEIDNIKKSGDQFTGDINITGSVDGEDGFDIDISLGKSGSAQSVDIEGEFSDGWDTYDIGAISMSYSSKSVSRVNVSAPSDEDYGVIMGDYSDDNVYRAEEMSAELEYLLYDTDEYDDNELVWDLLYTFKNYADDIIRTAQWYN